MGRAEPNSTGRATICRHGAADPRVRRPACIFTGHLLDRCTRRAYLSGLLRAMAEQADIAIIGPGKVGTAIGILAGRAGRRVDLGGRPRHLEADTRGFAVRPGVARDMRREGGDPDTPTASEILNEADEADLARIFREYGEEPRARRLARQVVGRRADAPLRTSDDLVAVLARALGRSPRTKEKARIFQSLRIAVNGELDALDRALPMIRDALGSGAAMVVISYHSLEDRLVKNAFREWSRSCVCPPRIPLCTCRGAPLGSSLTRTPVRPREAEVKLNPRARSGRLRAWRKA